MGFRKEINIVAAVATVTAGFIAEAPAFALDPTTATGTPVRVAQAMQLGPDSPAPVVRPAPAKPPVAPKPVAKAPVHGQKPATTAAKPQKPAGKVAKSTAAKVPPAAKKAVSLAALTGQEVIPDHKHQVINVPPTPCPGNPDAIGISRIIKVDTPAVSTSARPITPKCRSCSRRK